MSAISTQQPASRSTAARGLLPITVYLLLAIVLTWPTIRQLTTHLPGDGGDDPAIAWNLWWVKFALLNSGQNPFHTDFMFYPLGVNLAFYTLTVLNALTALPFTLNLGVTAASNLHILFTFVVSGYGTFLLVKYLLTHAEPGAPVRRVWFSALLAGGFYAFAGSKLFYVALGQFNIGSSHWIPFAALYLVRMHRHPQRLKNAALTGLFFSMQAWAEMTYASFLLVLAGLYWSAFSLAFLWRNRARHPARALFNCSLREGRPHALAALVMLAVFGLGIAPILAQMLPDMLAEGDFFVVGSGFAQSFSADLLGFAIPTMLHPLLGNLIRQTGIGAAGSVTGFDKGQHIYLGVSLATLAVTALVTNRRRPAVRFWALAALVFGLLTLGPVISVNGQSTGIPGPFVLFQQLPFFKGNRYPSRYSVMLLLSLSVLSGFALLWLMQQRRRWASALAGLLALVFLFEHLSAPLPQSDMRLPGPYRAIIADERPGTVLDIPFAWRNGFRITGALTTQFMFGQFYQTAHQKPMLQGNTSRNPEFKFQYFTEAPVINSLLALETGKQLPPERWDADRALAVDVLNFFNIRTIVVRPNPDGNPAVTPQAAIPYIEQLFPAEKIYADDSITIFRVIPPPPEPIRPGEPYLRVDPTGPRAALAPLYFGEGWGRVSPGKPVSAQRRQARLLLPFAGSNPHQISLRLRAPAELNLTGQTVSLAVGGWQSAPQPVSADWQTLTFDVPSGVVQPGLNNVYLNFGRLATLPPLPPGPLFDVTALSAGEEVGGFAHIFANGHEVSPNRRGYNIAVIGPDGVRAATFDTHLDPQASVTLVDFLAGVPPDSQVVAAAADEASARLSAEAVQVIQQATGASGDLRGCFRCSHAVIGAASGSPLEQLDALRPASITTGWGLTEPTMAAQVENIQLTMTNYQ